MQGENYEGDYGGEPIPFLEIVENENHEVEFVLSPHAEEYLKQMTNKKVAVLTIAGPQRSGKSFLANRFLKKMNGFAIGPTTNPCTKGIWLWGKPISLNNEIDLLIMDTEGLNSTQRDQTIDMKIFSISILISSYFMYNSFGHIDENALENLSLVVHLSENISISANSNNENDYSKYFPYFHWVLRDFSLDLKGRSSNQYLDYALQAVQGNDPDKQRKNNIRNKIKDYFKARDCTCLVRPLGDEKKLAHIEEQHWDDLRPEFREHVEKLVNNVLASIRPKIIQGKPLTGEMLLNLVKNYLQALNTGGVPQILTSMERVISSEMKRIFDTLVKEYMSMIEEAFHEKNLPMPEDELIKKHKDITNLILKKLSTNGEIIGHKEVGLITQKLTQGFEKNFKNRMDMNEEKIAVLSNKSISKFGAQLPIPHAADLQDGFSELKSKIITPFKDAYNEFYDNFKSGLKGSNRKFAIYSDMVPKIIFEYYDKILEICEQLKEEEVDDVKKKLEQAREGEEALRQILDDKQSLVDQLKQDKNEIRSNFDQLKEEHNQVLEHGDREKERLQHRLNELEILLGNEKLKNDSLYSQIGTSEGKLKYKSEEELLEFKGEVKILQDKEKLYKKDIERLKQQVEALENALDEASTNPTQIEHSSRPEKKKHQDLPDLDEDDFGTSRPAEVEGLIAEIVLLRKKIKELQGDFGDETLREEETKDSKDGRREIAEEDLVLLDDSHIEGEQLLALCPNDEMKEKIKIILTNYSRQKLLFQKKLSVISRENNRLKAEIIDMNDKMKEVKKKDEQIEILKKDNKNLNTTINQTSKGLIGEGTPEMQIAQLKAEKLMLEADKENVLYFIKELIIMKIKKKKNHHFDHAYSALNENDQKSIKEIFEEVGFKP